MKISRIEIQDFQQFKNLNIDLTYPQGHAKAGQPLDKVCIIGQNGTGKTTILKFIHDYILANQSEQIWEKYALIKEVITESQQKQNTIITLIVDEYKTRTLFSFTSRYNFRCLPKGFNLFPLTKKFIYIPTNAYTLVTTPTGVLNPNQYLVEDYFKLNDEFLFSVKGAFYNRTFSYQKAFKEFSMSIVNAIIENPNENSALKVQKWRGENPNPLEEIAYFIDKLLAPAGMKLKTTVNEDRYTVDIQFISLQNGKTIPFEQLSSGSKSIFLTAYALYQQIENESIILIDEPENSLYPNLQRAIVPTYTSLRPDAETQFFFATHSPVIASCFEPWEIVDLELDDDNHVVRHLYYEGENHVDNYTIYPQYLRWDSIMNKVFDIKDVEGGELREEELQKMVETKNRLDHWKSEGKTAKTDERMREELEVYKKLLAKLY